MKVYVLKKFKRYRVLNYYGDYGRYYEEEDEIVDIYLNEKDADQIAQELQEKWGDDDYDNEQRYYVEMWKVIQ